jgi:hypothetical protein
MKRKIKVFGIIALVAVIGLMMSNCDPNDSTELKMVRAKYLFSGDPNNSAGRSILPNRSVARGVDGGVQGAEKLEELYTKLGAFKESITPTKLELPVALMIWQKVSANASGGGVQFENVPLAYGNELVDLANPLVVSACLVVPGDYSYADIVLPMTGVSDTTISRISFPKPEGFNYETHAFNIEYKGYIRGDDNYVPPDPVNVYNISIEGNIISGDLSAFEPYSVNMNAWLHGSDDGNTGTFLGTGVLGSISRIFMGGNTYKTFNALPETPVIKVSTYLPGIPDFFQLNFPDALNFLIPFSGITVPENANAVRFEVYWNIDGIIERYEGATASPDDDIFILKNGFWEDFSIQAFIE